MAKITFTISDTNIPYFVSFYGLDYEALVSAGEIDGDVVTKAQYAHGEAFKFMAAPVRKWHKQQLANELPKIDITAQ